MKKSKRNSIHRGELLKNVAAASGLSVEEIVQRMNYSSRNTFYNHTKRKDLSLIILQRYGRVLRYDFSSNIEEISDLMLHEDPTHYLPTPTDIADAISQRDFYHKLYMELLEKLRELERDNAALRNEKPGSKKR